jgi:hypothetical protein
MILQYPEVFVTGKPDYQNDKKGRAEALSDALTAWGNTHMGLKPPEKFREGMVEVAKFLKLKDSLPETFLACAEKP